MSKRKIRKLESEVKAVKEEVPAPAAEEVSKVPKVPVSTAEEKPKADWHVRALYGSRSTVLLSLPREIVREAGLRKGMKTYVDYDKETDTLKVRITERNAA
ncbi:MAG: hypothetical protein OEZ48_01515 [Candidatus Bathyarchaeota archaeon]|nr:hypothetical protein [Candidatus Bathyarchaeota archaeon]